MDEDEVVELVTVGTGAVRVIPTGIDYALGKCRSRYVEGHIEADEFEAETERLMRKREAAR